MKLPSIRAVILCVALVLPLAPRAQAQVTIAWQHCYGGSRDDEATTIVQTHDGGYFVCGYTGSTDGDVKNRHDILVDGWALKLDRTGKLLWQTVLGGSSADNILCGVETIDGGYILVGALRSSNIPGVTIHGDADADMWIVRLDSGGAVLWQKAIGGVNEDVAMSVVQASDGGYAIAGYTMSTDGDMLGDTCPLNMWIVKLDSIGSVQWHKALGRCSDDLACSLDMTADGGYILAGHTAGNDDSVPGPRKKGYMIVRLDSVGGIRWQRVFGGSMLEQAWSVKTTPDGGCVVAGEAGSQDGDVADNHGHSDFWILKLDSNGTLQWQKALGGKYSDTPSSIALTIDGGYIVAGNTESEDGDVTHHHVDYLGNALLDAWVVKLDSAGTLEWQKCLGGDLPDGAQSIIQIPDGNFVVAGWTMSSDGTGDVSGNHRASWSDVWVVKLVPDRAPVRTGDQPLLLQFLDQNFPNPFSASTNIAVHLAFPDRRLAHLRVTNILGELVVDLTPQLRAGTDLVVAADQMPAGIYFYTLDAGGRHERRQMSIVK